MKHRVLLTALFAVLCLNPAAQAGKPNPTDWTQWRGPTRDGRIIGPQWPASLSSENLQKVWSVGLGPSYSGPIVVEDRVFVTETQGRRREVVRALDRQTGKQIWESSWEGAMSVPFFAKANGDWIRSTPAYDDGRLYVAGIRDVLVCLDAESGKEQWRVDFVRQLGTPLPKFGCVCSPLISGDYVYVQAGASFAKVDKRSGKIIWRTLKDGGGMYGSAFSSPTLAKLAGKQQILVQTRTSLAGVDPNDGRVLWSSKIPAFRGMNIVTPTVSGDTVFTSAYGGRSLLFGIAQEEGAFRLTNTWTNKAQGYMSSPVVIDGHAYLHLRNQRLTCIELASGKTKWTTRPYGKYWSLIANGKHILALDQRGELLLIRANPNEFELLGRQKVSNQETWAHLAISGNEILVRELNAITSFRWKKTSPALKAISAR